MFFLPISYSQHFPSELVECFIIEKTSPEQDEIYEKSYAILKLRGSEKERKGEVSIKSRLFSFGDIIFSKSFLVDGDEYTLMTFMNDEMVSFSHSIGSDDKPLINEFNYGENSFKVQCQSQRK